MSIVVTLHLIEKWKISNPHCYEHSENHYFYGIGIWRWPCIDKLLRPILSRRRRL